VLVFAKSTKRGFSPVVTDGVKEATTPFEEDTVNVCPPDVVVTQPLPSVTVNV
jgi:hypothetical protein